MRHQDLTLNHRLESWVYANAAARTGASGFVSGDIGRIAYQTDTGQYWRLTAITPTWQLVAPPLPLVYASLQTAELNPTGTVTVSPGKMMGLGVGNLFTPTATGKMFVTISGAITCSTTSPPAGNMRYGTVTAPINGATPSGTIIGSGAIINANVANQSGSFSISAVLIGTVGTAYWFDMNIWAGSGSASITAVTVTIVELP